MILSCDALQGSSQFQEKISRTVIFRDSLSLFISGGSAHQSDFHLRLQLFSASWRHFLPKLLMCGRLFGFSICLNGIVCIDEFRTTGSSFSPGISGHIFRARHSSKAKNFAQKPDYVVPCTGVCELAKLLGA